MTMPITPVINPPVRNEMNFGATLEKSFDGATVLAAMLVLIWAIMMTIMMKISRYGFCVSIGTSFTGFHTASSKTTTVAAVVAMPTKLYAIIVTGRPMACPT